MSDIFETLEATWPAARKSRVGPWEIKEGKGGGKRVMAAKAIDPVGAADVALAENAMKALEQPKLFVLRDQDEKLDSILAERGYEIVDPTLLFESDIVVADVPPVTAFEIWPPLQIMLDLWVEDGVGPDRIAVMERGQGPKTSILGRIKDRAAGAAFVAIHGQVAMVHAVLVLPEFRRCGLGRHMMQAVSNWAAGHGATRKSLAVTDVNAPAKSLYSSLGMVPVGRYHYRIKP
ncbi:acetyltransferase (GNAT) family protein [Litoreibacter ponti]|uniref:Acetyltransferase (GNAT) family protein n=1 Tax=Litoreibacter ponti TaxID=1510457 RepID=A0A2T6BNY3_9RHOB|nr:GNAT family N-acetyltransferase [Litoreibacter ponti]PTX57793.1 acetyltransferase (GNAT) family protein [Litoreibacter ponti]